MGRSVTASRRLWCRISCSRMKGSGTCVWAHRIRWLRARAVMSGVLGATRRDKRVSAKRPRITFALRSCFTTPRRSVMLWWAGDGQLFSRNKLVSFTFLTPNIAHPSGIMSVAVAQLNRLRPTDPVLITTMQMTFMAENLAIVLNALLLIVFYLQIRAEQAKRAGDMPSNGSRTSSLNSPSKKSSISNDKQLNWHSVFVTFALLAVGFIFSLFQGLVENWLMTDCGVEWLQWSTFFFYAAHRSILLLSFLHRLVIVFRDSAYAYPNWFHSLLGSLIFIHFVASFVVYGIDHDVTFVDIQMYTGYSGVWICSWSFGVTTSYIIRPSEIALTVELVLAFLCVFPSLCSRFPRILICCSQINYGSCTVYPLGTWRTTRAGGRSINCWWSSGR